MKRTLIAVLALALLGCTQQREYEENQVRKTKTQWIVEETDFEMIYLSYPSVYLLKFRGHEYLTRGSNSRLLHAEACPGYHGE